MAKLVVLGGGPGGYPAAFAAADAGMEVTLVDEGVKPGGVCLHRGCIPSKALLHVAKLINEAREASEWGISFGEPDIDLDKLRDWKGGVVEKLTGGIEQLCKARGVNLIKARGKFTGSQSMELTDADGKTETLEFEKCIIATGSIPTIPGPWRIENERVMDSTAALNLPDTPERLLVIGGGYIGLEMGTVYAALGSEVTVVEMTSGLLPGADRDLVNPLKRRLESQFESILLNTKVESLEAGDDSVTVKLTGEDAPDKASFDRVLVAVGRTPNSNNLGLETTRVELDDRGFIKVNPSRKTNDPHLWAIGDIAGEPMLAHKATHEAKVVIGAMNDDGSTFDPYAIPAVVFTDPEVAWCGLTETEAKEQGKEVNVFRFPWAASGRAQTLGRTEGVTKLIADPETERLLGVGIVGSNAGELIAEGVLAIEMGATATDLGYSIHAHPTLSETLMEAAEGLEGNATHVYRPKRK